MIFYATSENTVFYFFNFFWLGAISWLQNGGFAVIFRHFLIYRFLYMIAEIFKSL